jgi:hypothetical protein
MRSTKKAAARLPLSPWWRRKYPPCLLEIIRAKAGLLSPVGDAVQFAGLDRLKKQRHCVELEKGGEAFLWRQRSPPRPD